jgi:hypothetical protein
VLVRVLSVGRGTKVQWIYRDTINAEGAVVERLHAARITRPYAPLSPIDPRASGATDTIRFVERGYTHYRERRATYRLDATTDAYIDAKIDADFIEFRGVKLAVALEAVKHAFAEHRGADSEWLLPLPRVDAIVRKLTRGLRALLELLDVDAGPRERIADDKKVRGLFRRSFKELFRDVASDVGLAPLGRGELDFFVDSRDALVHQGRFSSTASPPGPREFQPARTPREEFLFDVYFLDRIFLGLLGYDGRFLDARDPAGGSVATLARPAAGGDPLGLQLERGVPVSPGDP